MSGPDDRLEDLILSLTPIHEAVLRFVAGGPDRGREIERLFRELGEMAREIEELVLDSDDDEGGDD